MTGLEIAFLVIAITAFLFFIISLIAGEIFDGVIDFVTPDIDISVDGIDVLNSKVVFAGLVGFGATGYVTSYFGMTMIPVVLCALAGFFVVSIFTFFGVVKPLERQQSNSSISRISYVGLSGSMIVGISGGTGIVGFYDSNNSYIRETAYPADSSQEIPTGTPVTIHAVNPGSVIVTLTAN